MKQLKIAYILHRFPYLTETFIMREVYWLRKQGVDVNIYSLLSPQHDVVHEQATELLEVTHYSPFLSWNILVAQWYFLVRSPIRYFRSINNLIRQTFREPRVLLRSLLLFPKSVWFAQLIEENNADHIHSHFVWIDGIAAGVASDLTGITFSIHPHAFGLFSRNQKSVKCELEHADHIVTISNFHKDYIHRLCPAISQQDVDVVYCALETDLLKPFDRTLKEDSPIRILSVGRMVEKKGFQFLVASCKQLLDRQVDFKCHIIGGGTLKKELQNQINQLGLRDHVELVGSMTQKQVLEYYQNCDIFALPCVVASDGDRDGIPVVLMEAMAFEIPVVTTPVTGIPDLVQHGRTGLLVAERNTEGLTAAIQRLIEDENLRQTLGRQGRESILEKFDIRTNTSQLASIFRRVSNTEFSEASACDSEPGFNSLRLKQTTQS